MRETQENSGKTKEAAHLLKAGLFGSRGSYQKREDEQHRAERLKRAKEKRREDCIKHVSDIRRYLETNNCDYSPEHSPEDEGCERTLSRYGNTIYPLCKDVFKETELEPINTCKYRRPPIKGLGGSGL